MPELLLELLSEEIPARMQARAADDLKRLVCQGLDKAGLAYACAEAFVTPRRLALVVDGLPDRQPDVTEERKGPRVGSPDKAVQGFLRAAGLASVDQAEVRGTDKGQFYFAVSKKSGRPTTDVVRQTLGEIIELFPWQKTMRWAENRRFRWIRPLHRIVFVFGGEYHRLYVPIPFRTGQSSLGEPLMAYLDVPSENITLGHRFLAPEPFTVSDFADYRAKLRAAKVVLDPAERRQIIRDGAERLAAAEGLVLRDDPGLLDEVTGLVEWPVPMLGRIDEAFMDVPAEVLITAMRAHQKYFSLLRADGSLAPRFILVANTETADGGKAIVAGNERVLRARLSDAKYFWDQDRKRALAGRVPKLAERVFHAKLGSDLERVGRLEALARWLAPQVGADPTLAARAAHLCKADLMSQMVGEFPELQGIMGRYYALHDGEPAAVADAVAEHYAPKGPSDRCPTASVSVAVALADKIDTLVGFFAIGEKPTGSSDPFALRRAALGVIRLVIENNIRLSLRSAFSMSYQHFLNIVSGKEINLIVNQIDVILEEGGFTGDVSNDIDLLKHYIDDSKLLFYLNRGAVLTNVFGSSSHIRHLPSGGVTSDALEALKQKVMHLNTLAWGSIFDSGIPSELNYAVDKTNVRELTEEQLPTATQALIDAGSELAEELLAFFADRLKVHFREQGVRHDLVTAVFADGREDDLVRLLARVDALRDFLNTDDGANLLTAYRRASNIVRIEETKDGMSYEGEAEPRLLSEQRETELHQALSEARGRIAHALAGEEFREAMAVLAGLRPPVDAFFDQVQVNCADRDLRVNRLKLLSQIRSALGGVADFSQIEG